LVQRFEQQRRGSILPKLAPVDRVQFLMKERGMTVSDLGRVLGSQPSATSVLRGKRMPTSAQIVKLANHFGVSPALFIE
jgi:antitoxin component HigA of HigAB toxin-antitoxin module